MKDCLVAFGSNLGESLRILEQAGERVKAIPGVENFQCSSPLQTKQVGGPVGQNDFLNACLRFDCSLTAQELFTELIEIEAELGRTRNERWGSRKIDLDLLLFGDDCVEQADPSILIPHPRMSFRRFVLEPAMEIASDMVVPNSKLNIEQLLERLETAPKAVFFSQSSEGRFECAAKSTQSVCDEMDWRFEEILSLDAAIERQHDVRLFVFVGHDDRPFVSQADRFPGPTLRLTDASAAATKVEVEAAIQAMERL